MIKTNKYSCSRGYHHLDNKLNSDYLIIFININLLSYLENRS